MEYEVFESIKISHLPKQKHKALRESSNTRPALWAIEEDGVRAVVKDFSSNGFLFRNIVGRFLVWREGRAYRALEGLKGVPELYGIKAGLALFIEEIPASNVESIEKETRLSKDFFWELQGLVDSIHKRGLVHCDLKRAPNILLGHDGRPYIVDWSAAILKQECKFFPLNLIYERFVQDDLNAVTKIKLKHCPESVGHEEKMRYSYRSRPERVIRAIRDRARAILQRIA